MKTSQYLFLFLFLCSSFTFAQKNHDVDNSKSIVVNNDKVKVVKYIGKPQGNVCGLGEHHHDAHLTVALTDANVLITSPDGKQQIAKIPAGTAIWFEAGTHSVINKGNSNTKFLLIYLKK